MNKGELSSAHFQGVIGRLSEKIALMTVETASLHQRIDEYKEEIEAKDKIINDQDAKIARYEHDAAEKKVDES